jgi:hypothetical protein
MEASRDTVRSDAAVANVNIGCPFESSFEFASFDAEVPIAAEFSDRGFWMAGCDAGTAVDAVRSDSPPSAMRIGVARSDIRELPELAIVEDG